MEADRRVQPMGTGDVLDGMFGIFRDHWRAFVVAVAVVLVPWNILSAFLQRDALGPGFFTAFTDPAAFSAGSGGASSPPLGLSTVIGALGGMVVTPLLLGACVVIAAQAWRGGRPEPWPALRTAGGRLAALVGAVALLSLGALVPGVIAGVLGGVAASFLAAGGQVAVAVAVGIVVVLAVLLAMAVAAVLLSLGPVVVMTERLGPVKALRRSWRLVKPRFWARAGTLVLVFVVVGVIGMVLSLPLSLIGSGLGGSAGWVLLALGGIASGLVTTPLAATGMTLVYMDARIRSEGLDLHMLADELSAEPGDRRRATGPEW